MVTIKILGAGCKRCIMLENKVKELIDKYNIEADIQKVTQIEDIMNYNIMTTPGLVINEKVKSAGYIPKDEQILNWIKEG